MTRKHYQLIADALAQLRRDHSDTEESLAVVDDVIDRLAYALSSTNDRFDRVRFANASRKDLS